MEKETKKAAQIHRKMAKGLSTKQKMMVDAIDFNKLADIIDDDKLFSKCKL